MAYDNYPAARQHETHAKKGARNKRSTAQTKAPNISEANMRKARAIELITVALTNPLPDNVLALSA